MVIESSSDSDGKRGFLQSFYVLTASGETNSGFHSMLVHNLQPDFYLLAGTEIVRILELEPTKQLWVPGLA
jgi:hypothetical protein